MLKINELVGLWKKQVEREAGNIRQWKVEMNQRL